MQPRVYVPFGIRHLVTSQVTNQLKGVLQGLKDHLESDEYLATAAASRGNGRLALVGKGPAAAFGAGGLSRRLGFGNGSWPGFDINPLRVNLRSINPSMEALQGLSVERAAKVWADSWQRNVPHLQQLAAGLGSLHR